MISQLLVDPIQVIDSIEELNLKGITTYTCDILPVMTRVEVKRD